jgi:hypothetical protein
MKTTFQNYKNYKLPITVDPLEYGKLMLKIDQLNMFIVSITPKTIVIITKNKDFNFVKFFRSGDFIFDYKEYIINNNSFIRIIGNTKFKFENNKLISIETDNIQIYRDTDAINLKKN